MANETQKPLQTYRANCHCGSFVYEIDLPKVDSVTECNCSYCTKKGYLLIRPKDAGSLRVVKGDIDGLSSYTFGAGKIHHKFCPHCGTGVIGIAHLVPGQVLYGFNIHAFQDFDTWSLEQKTPFDGAALGEAYEIPKYEGPQPAEEVEGGQTYTGSCHCGKVQVALSSKPLDETFPEPVAECKCSICERNAYLWVWPMRVNVALHGDDKDIGRYVFGKRIMSKTFCKTCGVQLTNEPRDLSDEEVAALSDDSRAWYEGSQVRHPVNLRVLNGVDLKKLTPMKLTQGAELEPKYVNP